MMYFAARLSNYYLKLMNSVFILPKLGISVRIDSLRVLIFFLGDLDLLPLVLPLSCAGVRFATHFSRPEPPYRLRKLDPLLF